MKVPKKLWMSAVLPFAAMMILGTACGGGDSEEEENTKDTTVAQDTSGRSDIAEDESGEEDIWTPADLLGEETVLSDVQEDLATEDLAKEDLATEDLATEDLAKEDIVAEDIPVGPAGHTENMSGVMHKPGKTDPLSNCTMCHGQTLVGGAGPSCYMCHNNNDHTKSEDGHKHKSGSSSSCAACHGPNNTGGIGPACSTCH